MTRHHDSELVLSGAGDVRRIGPGALIETQRRALLALEDRTAQQGWGRPHDL